MPEFGTDKRPYTPHLPDGMPPGGEDGHGAMIPGFSRPDLQKGMVKEGAGEEGVSYGSVLKQPKGSAEAG